MTSVPSVSPESVIYFIVFVGIVIGVVYFLIKQTSLGTLLGLESENQRKTPPPDYTQPFTQHHQIVKSIDRLALWLFGDRAKWWNSRMVKDELETNRPEMADQIKSIMEVYEDVRYTPGEPEVTESTASSVQQTLSQLADPSRQNLER